MKANCQESGDILYREQLTDWKTSLLFAFFATLFAGFFALRFQQVGWKFGPILFLSLSLLFWFYLINYFSLEIIVTSEELILKFGVFCWRESLSNLARVSQEDLPIWIRYGGAGIHFALVRGNYTVFYNFLDHPRLIINLIHRRGLVQQVCISTCCPDQIHKLLDEGRNLNAEN
jgi:hypothetical protein